MNITVLIALKTMEEHDALSTKIEHSTPLPYTDKLSGGRGILNIFHPTES
jgi:hypothetical protein